MTIAEYIIIAVFVAALIAGVLYLHDFISNLLYDERDL